MQDLLPGRTVAVVRSAGANGAGGWTMPGPTLALNHLPRRAGRPLVKAARRLGWQPVVEPVRQVRRFLERNQADVIMGEYLDESWPWIGLAKAMGIRFVGHAHGYDVSIRLRDPVWRARYREYNETAGVIAVSHHSAERLAAAGVDRTKIHVVPCGVDVPSCPVTRHEHAVVRCLAVGRMVEKKAPIFLLDAFRRAAQGNNRLRLDYVGAGALLPAARQFIRAFQLEPVVTLHGGQPSGTVATLLDDADIFLQHSITDPDSGDEEGLPVAILEAMAHSLPVVSTRHAGIPEAVADGATGYLVDEGDSAGMAERTLALAANVDLRNEMGDAGWRRARDRFAWAHERNTLLEILAL
jgi:glycosyltransferase involved in cell wall biosynthesis